MDNACEKEIASASPAATRVGFAKTSQDWQAKQICGIVCPALHGVVVHLLVQATGGGKFLLVRDASWEKTVNHVGAICRHDVGNELVGCWLLVVGCWLLVVGCWLLVVGCWSLVVGRWSLVVGRWTLDVGRWTLGIGHWALGIGRWALMVVGMIVHLLTCFDDSIDLLP
jgi:hypothetical protein